MGNKDFTILGNYTFNTPELYKQPSCNMAAGLTPYFSLSFLGGLVALRILSTALLNVILSFSGRSFVRIGFASYSSICFCSFSASFFVGLLFVIA